MPIMGNSMTSALLALVLVVPSFRCIAFGASSSADASTFDSNLSKGFPNNDPLSRRIPIPDKPSLEWTALGDSYASGVGTTKYQGGMRCLRFDEAYPQLINLDPYWSPGGDAVFPPGLHKLNNVVCSGAEAQDILDWQLLDNPTRFEPDITYGKHIVSPGIEDCTVTLGNRRPSGFRLARVCHIERGRRRY